MDHSINQSRKKKRFSVLQTVRICIQIVFFVLLPALYINTFMELKIVLAGITGGSDLGTMLPQIIELLAVVPATILLGRFFCGWMCAFGAFGDFIFGISKKLFKVRFQISTNTDRILKLAKYGMLAFVVIFLWMYNIPGLSAASPWDVFGMLAAVGTVPNISYIVSNLTVGFVFFTLIAVGSAFIQRFFCRYLCPLGAVFSLLSVLKITGIQKPGRKCGNCRACTSRCAMGIPLYQKNSVRSGECIECLQCVSACPRYNVRLSIAGNNVRPLVAGTIAAIAIAGVYGTTNYAVAAATAPSETIVAQSSQTQPFTAGQPTQTPSVYSPAPAARQPDVQTPQASDSAAPSTQDSASPSANQSTGRYTDGTYTGAGTGFRGAQTKVSVTVKNGTITDIVTQSYGDNPPYYQRAFRTVCSQIKSSQSANVDTVSGATYSSQGIMEAVSNALKKAIA